MRRYISFLQGNTNPAISVTPNPLDMGLGYTDYEAAYDLAIQNIGLATLTVSQIQVEGTGFNFTCETPCDLEPGAIEIVPVTFNSTTPGTFSGALTITSNDTDHETLEIPLTIEVVSPPDIDVSPTSLEISVAENSSGQGTVNIANTGIYSLDYSISLSSTDAVNYVAPDPVVRENRRVLRKGEVDDRPGGSTLDSRGGPDQFGNWWMDHNEEIGPEFEWFDISEIGTSTGLTGDDASIVVTLPFEFPFYGQYETSVTASTNGYLTFGTAGSEWTNANIPDGTEPNAVIAPFWDDMLTDDTSQLFAYYDTFNHRFILQYSSFKFYNYPDPPIGDMNFQIHLCENGDIFFYYQTLDGLADSSPTVGIENYNGGDGLRIAFNSQFVTENMAIRITDAPSWIIADTQCGSIAANNNENITFTCYSTGLEPGDYSAFAIITSNDPDEARITVPITMTIIGNAVGEMGLLPEETKLHSCYPNPFNPSTVIPFDLAQNEHVCLEVFNVLGQRVGVLIDREMSAGSYKVTFSVKEIASLTSGTYFYKMNAGKYSSIRKMVLVK